MSLLVAHGLTRAPWFRDFALEVAEGEIVVLRGASGSGKTLLLRTLADLDAADAGVGDGPAVRLRGVERDTMSACAWRSRVLYVHPDGARLGGTVAGNLEAVGRLAVRRGASIDKDVPGLAGDAAIENVSSGEAQVIALARALACEPDVLLLDEPTSSMDPERARAWEARLAAWAAAGHAIVWITHEDALAARLGARVVPFP